MIQNQSQTRSIPSFSEFSPDAIPFQRLVYDYLKEYDYSQGILEILLSGSVGSAKSLLAAHLIIDHCLRWPRAKVMLGRRSLPDLKETIFQTICDHLEGTRLANGKILEEGKHYKIKETTGQIYFPPTKSEIISRSWSDKRYKKFRSLALSAAVFEELTENSKEDRQAYVETTMRVGRIPHIKESWILSCTNPDAPSHWVYERFMVKAESNMKVFYSKTADNPFLPESYIETLKRTLDPKQAMRMLYGQWVEIQNERIYYAYDSEKNFKNQEYKVNTNYPIYVGFDFNIGLNKPLSSCVMQFIDDKLLIFGEAITEGLRTVENCDVLASKGYLDYPTNYIICGDASGKNRDTRNKRSDYDLIKGFFATYTQKNGQLIRAEFQIPKANPPIRKRHNLVNGYCENANGDIRLFVYKEAPTCDEGLRQTKPKKGSFEEDDSDSFQHVTTAIGYTLCNIVKKRDSQEQDTLLL